MEASLEQVVLVTGANRGIGLEVCRQMGRAGWIVILGSRDIAKGQAAAAQLRGDGVERVRPVAIDVTSDASVEEARLLVELEYGRLDSLVNNAAVNYDSWQRVLSAELPFVRETLEANLLGPWRMCRAFAPLVRHGRPGRIVNVSSRSGSFGATGPDVVHDSGLGGGPVTPAYGVSKAALNALTVKVAAELRPLGVKVNAVCPGWTATYEGGLKQGARPVAEGAAGIVWAATLPADGPTGGFFRDGKPLPW